MDLDLSEGSSTSVVGFEIEPRIYVFNPRCPTRVDFGPSNKQSSKMKRSPRTKQVLKKRKYQGTPFWIPDDEPGAAPVSAKAEAAEWLSVLTSSSSSSKESSLLGGDIPVVECVLVKDKKWNARHTLDLTLHARLEASFDMKELDIVHHERRDIDYSHPLLKKRQVPHIILCC